MLLSNNRKLQVELTQLMDKLHNVCFMLTYFVYWT